MKMPQIKLEKSHLFILFGLFWIGLGVLGLFSAMAGFFYKEVFLIYFIIFIPVLVCIFFLNKKSFKFDWYFFSIVIFSLVAISIFSYFTSPTIFSGRDQGTLSESAIRLSQNHKIESSSKIEKTFFEIYGPGKALNFPGFNFTSEGNLKTSFPLGYIAWLAIFYSLFGLSGFVLANGLAFLIFIVSFYFLSQTFFKKSSALVLIILTLTTFIFSWFFKFTLSENLTLSLLWFFIYAFVIFLKNKERFFFAACLISLGFLLFVRIESLAFLAIAIVILFLEYKTPKNIYSIVGKNNCFLALGIFLAFLLGLFVNKEFYLALAKTVIRPLTSTSINLPGTGALIIAWKSFLIFALLGFIILGIIGVIYFFKHRNWTGLLPFFLVAPTFFYLIAPNISSDSPWMLRRFLFAVIPACLFYTVYFLDTFFKKRLHFYLISSLLLILNLSIFVYFLSFSPHKNLLPQIEILSKNFGNTDLILIDREATGDPWAMMTGPLNFLYGKQAVYFFNPKDLDRIDLQKFNKVYFIIPDKNIYFYEKFDLFSKLEIKENYSIKNNFLENSNYLELPTKKELTIQGKIYTLKQP